MAMQLNDEVVSRIADRAFPGVETQDQNEAPAPAPELVNEPSEVQAFPGEGQRVEPKPKQEEAPAPAFTAEYEDLGDTAMPHKDTMLQAAQQVNDFWKEMQTSVFNERVEELNGTLTRLHNVANGLNLAPKDIFNLSKKSGLPPSMVDNDPKFAQLKIVSDEYAKSLETFGSAMNVNENTITFLYDIGEDLPAQLILTKDNTILNTERDLREANKGFSVRNFFGDRALGGAIAGSDNMDLIFERNRLLAKSQIRDLTPQEQERVDLLEAATSAYAARRKKEDVGFWNDITWATGESVVGTMWNLGKRALTEGSGTIAAGAALGAGLGSTALGVGMLPGMATGAGAGLTAEMVSGMYEQAVGDIVSELNDMERRGGATFDKELKRGVAMWAALPYTGAEYVGLKYLGKFLPKGVAEFFTKESAQKTLEFIKAHPTVASRIGESAMRMLKGMAGEVGTEIVQDVTVNTGAEIARLKTPELNLAPRTWRQALEGYWETGVETAKGLLIPGGGGGYMRFRSSQNNAARYEDTLRMMADTQDKLTNIIHKAATSTTMQDAPELAQGLMRKLADGEQLPATTYIAPEKLQGLLFQTENPDPDMVKAAEKLGITPESLEENLALGTDVAIDTVDLMGTKLMQDENVFNQLKGDLKYHPDMKTTADLDAFEEGMKDEQLRAEWLDEVLEPIRDEENEALSRAEVREEMMAPYFDQLKTIGYSDQKARAYTDVFARMAEQFAPVFGETPAEYLEKRFAGFVSMTPQEFIDVRKEADLGALFEDRAKAEALAGWGIKRNMTFPQIRRIIDPAFRAAYGRVSKAAFKRAYGQAGVETVQRQFGPGFWGKRGKALGLDVIAQESYEYNGEFGGSVVDADTYNAGVDTEAFWEKVMRPHDDVVGSFMSQFQQELGGEVNQNDGAGPVRWQFLGEQGAAMLDQADEATTRMDNLAVARDMEAAGKDAKAIKLATGWERGADGKWRYEIMDGNFTMPELPSRYSKEARDAENVIYDLQARYNANEMGAKDPKVTEQIKAEYDIAREKLARALEARVPLKDVFDAPELYAAYPELAELEVRIQNVGRDTGGNLGAAYDDRIEIYYSPSVVQRIPGVLAHEIQHKIQRMEGHARGSSPDALTAEDSRAYRQQMAERLDKKYNDLFDAMPAELQERVREYNRARIDKDFDRLTEIEGEVLETEYADQWAELQAADFDRRGAWQDLDTPVDASVLYDKTAGEVEARNVSARMNMTLEERLNSLASDTEDVAREDQYVIEQALRGGVQASMAQKLEDSIGAVRKQYQGTDAWMKAPNGQPTKLTERQWLQVRTPEFKAWFGDWEAAANYDFLSGQPVETIAGDTVPNLGKQSNIVEWAGNFFKSKLNGETVAMPVVGNVTLNKRSAKNSLSHGYGPEKIQALALLPDVLPKSRLLDSRKNKDGVQGYTFGAPVNIGGKDYVLIALVREDANAKSVYVHECILTEKIQQDIKTAASAEKGELTRSPAGAVRKVVNNIFSVNKESTSKIVDENGEPRVMYHGTEADIQEFAPNDGSRGDAGIFFTEDPDYADSYAIGEGASIYPAFVNIRNPLEVFTKPDGYSMADLQAQGHDGILVKPNGKPTANGIQGGTMEEVVAFEPNQIKSATGNNGQFDPNNPNILYQTDLKNAQGAMRKLADGRYLVGLFQKQNASTVLHELSHVWLEMFREAVQQESCPDWVKQEWAKAQKALGFEGLLLDPQSEEQWTQVQENWARQFEAYCREGKAPTWELQAAFDLFRHWLTEVYRSIKRLLAGEGISDTINPEVQEVFDHLLATQEEIDVSQRAVDSGSVMDLADVAPELKDKYAQAVEKAKRRASAIVANRHLVERRRAEEEFLYEAHGVLQSDPDYELLYELRQKGIKFDAIKGLGNDNVVYELQKKWRGYNRLIGNKEHVAALFRKDGELTDIDDIAAQFNEADAWGLLAKLQELPTLNEAARDYVAQRMEEWEAAYNAEIDYSAEYDQALAIEIEALTGQKQVGSNALRREMELRTGVKKLADVDRDYAALKAALKRDARVAKRAAKEGMKEGFAKGKAMSQKWKDKLAELKQKERVRRAALYAAYQARLERDKIVRQVRKIAKSKSIPYEFKQQILRIVHNWQGLGTENMRVSNEDLRSMPMLDEFLARYASETLFVGEDSMQEFLQSLAPDFLRQNTSGRMADLSIEQLRQVKATIDELAHLGRTHDKMLAQKRAITIENAAAECAESMNKLSGKKFVSKRDGIMGTIRSALRGGLSSLTAQRFMQRAMDGFNKEGANFNNWFAPLQKAVSDELILCEQMDSKLRAILTPLFQKWQNVKPFTIEGVPLDGEVAKRWGGVWDMEQVFTVALNMGNEGNLNALMRGYGWEERHLNAIVSRLSEEEWDAVQKVWDTINELYEPLNGVHKELKGAPLKKVQAMPFSVQMADGTVKKLAGGYYPLQFDPELSKQAREYKDADAALNDMFNVFRSSPTPASGMTKERTGGTLPPKLSLQVLAKHVRDTSHYVTHALPLRDAVQLFNTDTFRNAFVRAAGQENYDALNPWLKSLARPDGEKLRGMASVMDWMGRQSTAYALGANMKTAMMQLTSIGNSFNEVGFGNFAKAVMVLSKNPTQMWHMIRGKSAYMKNRTALRDETLRQYYAELEQRGITGVQFGKMTHALDTVRKAQFWLITAIDGAVAMPTWQAEYEKQINAGKSEEDAIAAADGAVVAAQSGGGTLDTAAVMRNAGIMRIVCPFMSFALGDFNRKMYHIRGYAEFIRSKGDVGINHADFFKHLALEWVMPVIMTCLITSLGRDDELPEGKDLLWEALTFYTMGIPVLRDVAKMGQAEFGGGFSGRNPLWLSGVDNAFRSVKQGYKAIVEDKEDASYKAIKAAINSVGFALGIGTPQIWRTLEGSEAQFVDGKGGVFAFLLGKPQEKK